jgi:hypothetical protein
LSLLRIGCRWEDTFEDLAPEFLHLVGVLLDGLLALFLARLALMHLFQELQLLQKEQRRTGPGTLFYPLRGCRPLRR